MMRCRDACEHADIWPAAGERVVTSRRWHSKRFLTPNLNLDDGGSRVVSLATPYAYDEIMSTPCRLFPPNSLYARDKYFDYLHWLW